MISLDLTRGQAHGCDNAEQESRTVPPILVAYVVGVATFAAIFLTTLAIGLRHQYELGEREWDEIVQWGMILAFFVLPSAVLFGLFAGAGAGVWWAIRSGAEKH